jgi:predicted nucleic acid-binding protein
MTVVLDSSFLADIRRGDEGAQSLLGELVAEGEAAIVPSVVVAEYLAGSRDPDEDFATLERAVALEDLRVADSREGASLARRMFEAGRFPGWIDTLVAGFAKVRGDLPIITRNVRHFPESRTRTY